MRKALSLSLSARFVFNLWRLCEGFSTTHNVELHRRLGSNCQKIDQKNAFLVPKTVAVQNRLRSLCTFFFFVFDENVSTSPVIFVCSRIWSPRVSSPVTNVCEKTTPSLVENSRERPTCGLRCFTWTPNPAAFFRPWPAHYTHSTHWLPCPSST